jgi:hypothetical protein
MRVGLAVGIVVVGAWVLVGDEVMLGIVGCSVVLAGVVGDEVGPPPLPIVGRGVGWKVDNEGSSVFDDDGEDVGMRVGIAVGILVEVVVVVGASVLVGDKVFGAFDTGLLDGLLVMLIVVGGLELGETDDDGCDVPTMCCVGAKVGGAIDGGGLAVVGALVGGDVVGFVVLLLSFVGTLVGSAVVTLLGVG